MRAFALSLFLVVSLSLGASAQPEPSMNLIAPGVGWVVQWDRLFWTNDDGAHWTELTPHDASSREIAGVFFLDASSGWVLFAVRNESNDQTGFDLASTSDGGANWMVTHVAAPPQDSGWAWASNGKIFFLDARHGWMDWETAAHQGGGIGTLLATTDGGRTWNEVRGFNVDGGYGATRFIDMQNGWVAGGPADQHLYVTHDGGLNWKEEAIPAPEGTWGLFKRMAGQYALPVFEGDGRGFLPVTYSGPDQSEKGIRALALFSTRDGGRTWRPEAVVNLGEDRGDLTFTAVDSEALAARPLDNTPLTLVKVGSGGRITETVAREAPTGANALELSFVDARHGWALCWALSGDQRLLSTADGGSTWRDITPGGVKASMPKPL